VSNPDTVDRSPATGTLDEAIKNAIAIMIDQAGIPDQIRRAIADLTDRMNGIDQENEEIRGIVAAVEAERRAMADLTDRLNGIDQVWRRNLRWRVTGRGTEGGGE